jgi:tRNA 5-methylaminomethyl-2-thiouridine biosynthesis bifunctional protein
MLNTHATQATLEWRDGQPYSATFDDVYFSSDNGLLETEYVFIQGNDLSTRWQSLNTASFQIIETGFGTGLNFLCAAKTWLAYAPESATLHYTSVEKYPLSLADMQQALLYWPELQNIADELLAQYTTLLSTGSISLYGTRIHLHLMCGDASACLAQIHNKADAWFLDGFAPAKNPDMWQAALFEQMARLSHTQTSFATFTSAGVVRRGLAAAGFQVNKKPGFGRKREMIIGCFTGTNLTGSNHDA